MNILSLFDAETLLMQNCHKLFPLLKNQWELSWPEIVGRYMLEL